MASRSLGVLTLDLIARTAGFIGGMSQAERQADKSTKKIAKAFSGLKGAIAGAFAGFTIAALIKGIVENSIEAENAIRQLEARIKSTGGVAGVSSQQIQDMASELQGLTTFGDDAIISMNALLLSFTNIRGDKVKGATRAILDVATALGQDLNTAATLVGKALDNPVKGMNALARVGVRFSEDQKKVIKALVETGDVAGAQSLILRELEKRFGGAAEAAANTFGGSIQQLKNAFGDLLENKGGLGEATTAVKDLTALLRDPETVRAAETLTTALFVGFTKVAEAIATVVNVTRFWGEEVAARVGHAAADDLVRLQDELERLQDLANTAPSLTNIDYLDRLRFFGSDGIVQWYSDEDLAKAIAEVKKKIANYNKDFPPLFPPPGATAGGGAGGVGGGGKTTPTLQEIKISIPKLDKDEMDKFWDELNDKTKTQEEKALASFHEQKEALEALWAAGRIGVDQYNARLKEINDELLPEIEVTAKKIPPIVTQATKDLLEIQQNLVRNTQNIIADTLQSLTDGSKITAREILQTFGNMLLQMAQQAIAANITEKLFGKATASGGTTGGWIAAIASFFTGKASGGPIMAGQPYVVGERGPEIIVPRSSGTVIPNGRIGGMVLQLTQNIQAPTEYAGRVTAQQAAAAAARSLALASRRNN